MNYKKRIIFTAIAAACVAGASEYKIIIDSNNNNYIMNEPVDTGNTRCSTVSPLLSEVYKDVSFTQSHTGCEKEVRNSNNSIYWTSISDFSSNEVGNHLESSCKDILAFDNTLKTDKSYPVIGGETLNCDMNTDGGGWTEVAHISGTYSVKAPVVDIDDKGIDHTQMLYIDNGSTSDLSYGDSSWMWQGMDKEKNVIKTNGQWRTMANARETCLTLPNTIPVSNYTTLEQNVSVCKWGITNDVSYCGRKMKVDMPSGGRFEGFGDIESVYESCHENNHFVLDYKLYIR